MSNNEPLYLRPDVQVSVLLGHQRQNDGKALSVLGQSPARSTDLERSTSLVRGGLIILQLGIFGNSIEACCDRIGSHTDAWTRATESSE
jgi:hypothetical protein